MRAIFMSSGARVALRIGISLLVIFGCALAMRERVSADVVLGLPDQLSSISIFQWCAAAVLTGASFFAVAQYDMHAHRALNTGISARQARTSGAVGIALGQTLGFGLVTGALARWRMLPDLSFTGALRLSAFVSVSFVASWAVIVALTCLIFPAPEWTTWPAAATLALVPVVAGLLFLWPSIRIAGHRLPLPSIPLAATIVAWALLDTVLAAGTLFVLLPAGTVPFVTFFPLFLIALGSGLISNTPGGVGPFELILLSALTVVDPAPLLAAVLAYRLIYYALPAGLAALMLLRPYSATRRGIVPRELSLTRAPRSEVGVIRQNGGHVANHGDSVLALWPTGQTVTMLADPIAGSAKAALAHLRVAARANGCASLIYKCGSRMAATARECGWRILHIADEALIDVPEFTTDIPARRTLRRKLRSADKAGMIIRSGAPLPMAAMARVDAEWQRMNGRARGGSMGQFCPEYIQHQWVGCAYVDGHLVAFATAHRSRGEWCLDILRQSPDAPDGTMHALVHTAVKAAQRADAAHFSLAATPACPDPSSGFWRWAAVQVAARAGSPGLRQFKSSFAPRWVPRYAVARSWPAMVLGLADIARAVHRPIAPSLEHTNTPHDLDENYELSSSRAA
jgi:phosphatidylglycerol lysyltransferase